ncbi:MAG: L-threonylcarbamoyladenylate synthase [Candidatus Berkelbacteria bacterium]
MKIIDINAIDSLENTTKVAKSGGVFIFPTDTVYGIGCVLEESAIEKLYKIKNRPANQPTAVLMNESVFDNYSLFEGQLPNEFWEGKMTIIFKLEEFDLKFPPMITENGTIGVRLPKHHWLNSLISQVGPIVATSANKKGEQTPTEFAQISEKLMEEVDLVIKTSKKLSQKASTIFDLAKNQILRS